MEAYSVLMTVYREEDPQDLATAIESMLQQTVRTDNFVVVCDGPLTEELDAVLNGYIVQYGSLFDVVRLPENVGIGAANRAGLARCKNELVAKMDADDVSVPQRCEKQLRKFEENSKLAVVGGFIEEFDPDQKEGFAIRKVPADYEQIRRFARRRQPFNNTTVMYRRSAVEAVGSYRNMRRCEDYDLYIRLLHAGYYAENLQEVIVRVKVDGKARSRRASWSTLQGCAHSRWRAFRLGYSSLWDVLLCVGGECVICICPGFIQQYIYKTFLRQS